MEDHLLKLRIIFKGSPADISHRLASRLFNAPHRHAHMLRLQNDHNALRLQMGHNSIPDLSCHLFLNLRPSGKHIHGPGQLAQTYDLIIRYIGNMCLPVKRQQMMLTGRIKGNILFQYKLIIDGRESFAQMDRCIRPQAA